ncbi:hypothetical protein M670_03177 [Schinkia azotoformans MEV2011]|uniref:Uncharacterized protein n=1 Tax=Schinkia azotoformans MEV2011 TaxID=1348973 RepID=A0A072NJI5_SCHAZ|nr:hypothetical protein [Schinkia azotoformans]KEF37596.1 hypothetical protein M670_03177 [Schinkia azotoformans MEV2011]MEC1695322.1 hypothetical protein [Schinkia azotoformans]MEC1724654.1 hypothetical protein [Schinkia azotoformans]MEC1771118.1 hypothetical protein [Schinkia azotoformans]MEC1777992.1 hypothetical protein [Schinkia azotoformans]
MKKQLIFFIPKIQIYRTEEKFGANLDNIKKNKSKLELTLIFNEKTEGVSQRIADIHGSIHIGNRAFGFKGKGTFDPFITPETNEIL